MRFPTQELPLDALLLDDENPRLPEHLHRASQAAILRWMYQESVLEELADSFIDHGYLDHEPIFVKEADGSDKWIVLEGNRRLAALMILTGHSVAQEAEIEFPLVEPPSEDALRRLGVIPGRKVDSREDVRHYVGFRHIGGLKEWPPEAKARWIEEEIQRRFSASRQPANVFAEIARSVGTSAQSIRGPYLALRILRFAQQEFEDPDRPIVTFVQTERFGVLVRATNSPDLRGYVAPGGPTQLRTLEEIDALIGAMDVERLRRVLADLKPAPGKARAVLSDSRDVTVYARALEHPIASRALAEYGDLQLAEEVLAHADLPSRVRRIEDSVRVILDEVQRSLEPAPEGAHDAARRLLAAVQALEVQLAPRLEPTER